jgi:hypothetical protein
VSGDENIDRVLERIRQGTEQRMRELRERRNGIRPATPGVTRAPTIGGRVFDTVSGEEGEVLGGGSENIVVPTTKR